MEVALAAVGWCQSLVFAAQWHTPPSPPTLIDLTNPALGNEAATYAENIASAVELLVLPTAAALEGLPELARNRVKLLFQSQRQASLFLYRSAPPHLHYLHYHHLTTPPPHYLTSSRPRERL